MGTRKIALARAAEYLRTGVYSGEDRSVLLLFKQAGYKSCDTCQCEHVRGVLASHHIKRQSLDCITPVHRESVVQVPYSGGSGSDLPFVTLSSLLLLKADYLEVMIGTMISRYHIFS